MWPQSHEELMWLVWQGLLCGPNIEGTFCCSIGEGTLCGSILVRKICCFNQVRVFHVTSDLCDEVKHLKSIHSANLVQQDTADSNHSSPF